MEYAENLDLSLVPIVQAMKEKFFKYWKELLAVTIIASCLHLSFKKKYIVLMLQRYKNNLRLPYIEEKARIIHTFLILIEVIVRPDC
jgi:S-adenosylhomocysteine hydrolase